MEGLLGFGSVGVWLALSVWIAWRAARLVKRIWLKALVMVAVGPLLFVAPVADELIGKFQYEHYCKEAEEVKIYGTIPVGEELYTPDGRWKLSDMSLSLDEWNQARKAEDSIIRLDLAAPNGTELPGIMPIWRWDSKVYEVKTGRLLAEYRFYRENRGQAWLIA